MEELRCPKCKSKTLYTRLRDNKRVCQRCGNIWDIEGSN